MGSPKTTSSGEAKSECEGVRNSAVQSGLLSITSEDAPVCHKGQGQQSHIHKL